MKQIVIISILGLFFCSFNAFGQSKITVAGTVIDENGAELIGVNIQVKENPAAGTVTDQDGHFRIEIPAKSTLRFSYMGYKPQEILYTATKNREKIALTPDINEFEEVVITGRGTQRKISVVGAVTNVEVAQLQVPAVSVSNMLGGRVPGIIAVTRSGEPGNNFSEFWVRGISTFGASQSALVLIDGVEGAINDLDPADIESFTILKDASATAVYGVRGANGVVVVTTKRGKAGKLKISIKSNATYSYSPRMPEYAGAYDYATLANEAQVVRGNNPIYTPAELELFKTGLLPDLYPDVNWRDVILKDHVVNNQHHLSASGGGESARYHLSLGVLNSEAIFKQAPDNTNNTNVSYNKYNFRGNIDASLTKSTVLSLNLETVFVSQNAPSDGTNNEALWDAQANMPPTLVPVKYSNGQLPAFGTNADQMSPYVRLNYTGFVEQERYSLKTNVSLKQDLGMLTEGLSVSGLFSLSTNGSHAIIRAMRPDLYYADRRTGLNMDGSLRTERKVSKQELQAAQTSASDRSIYFEATANYNRTFDDDHRVTGLVHYYLQENKNSGWGADLTAGSAQRTLSVIPKRYQAISGRATYSYKDTYLIEGNLGYTGSENFSKGNRYGLFPSLALGWIPSQYEIFQKTVPFIDYLKFRASYGIVGNDRLEGLRYPYLTIIGNTGSGTWGGSGIGETQTAAPDAQWETTKKYNVGVDSKFFNNRIDLVVDVFRNHTENIFQQRANIPEEAGMNNALPHTNIGSMVAWGTDGTLAYVQPVNKDMNFTVRGNFTLSRNKVDYWEQSGVNFPYQSYSGVPYGVMRGLIALGLFEDEEDIKSSPKQTFMDGVLPGDIKYKDVNGDGQVDDDDIVPLSYSNVPRIQYGFAAEFNYKNFGISAFLEGVGEVEYFYGGTGYYPFAWSETGNVLTMVVDQANRWTPASYSGTTATENPDARFPRLTYGENKNNNRASTFWLADGRYLRLKNVEISYRLPNLWMKKLGLESATISLVGDNLAVWDKVKLWDPGQASDNGSVYPLQRQYTVQLYINF
jgi:TonB-linked SusC/RagA family outer membrane protein